ncbi:hypothetical protein U9M48_004473 [Paspalum notatum var. saurae]|uniref:F-box domain-containing protein n=1 Tax=Paspalum notatum var. saurae TaxID=547442 RepID=A0AAQ3PKJ9_PASNO
MRSPAGTRRWKRNANARVVFDGMRTGVEEGERASKEARYEEDRISALPDEVIRHLLGFLPAPEAVRTSLLARGWRHHWKYMRSLRFTVFDGPVVSAQWVNRFMGRLLQDLHAPLDVCDIYMEHGLCYFVTELQAYNWVHKAVSGLHARDLMVGLQRLPERPSFTLVGKPLVSRHLARLDLRYVLLGDSALDFSSCTALEDLVLYRCVIYAKKIASKSLKRLRFKYCDLFHWPSPTCIISVPNLISLKLEHLVGQSPVYESVPWLEMAIVRLICDHPYNDYCCDKGACGECCGLCEGCVGNYQHSGGCKLLQCLSNATNLELTVPFAKFTDTMQYPEFPKLKTLFLNEWCVASNLHGLIYILQRSPILEKLTIQLNKTQVLKNTTELEENPYPLLQRSSVSENLKLVKVKCIEVDETVSRLSKLFNAFGKQINIEIGL